MTAYHRRFFNRSEYEAWLKSPSIPQHWILITIPNRWIYVIKGIHP